MEQDLFLLLAQKYLAGTVTEEERLVVEEYWEILSAGEDQELTPVALARIESEIRKSVFEKIGVRKIPLYRRSFFRYTAAAVFLFAIATTYLLIWGNKQSNQVGIAYKGDVAAPSINKATLTLANGKQITLDSVGKGSLAAEGAVNANKTGEGALAYSNKSVVVEFNTLTNPKGSRPVQLTLADGSIVWLNAASSIPFPTVFTGNDREVTMTGEAYFEVKHNAAQPFKVKTGNQVIEDLGTTFNVNAYADEPSVKTTLVEGEVGITSRDGGTKRVTLKPGEQYVNGIIETADIEQALAWKNGFFGFDNADLHTVMRQLARWYDVEVKFEGTPDPAPFQGSIDRNLTLAQVLMHLEQMHVHFRIEQDKRIVILP